MKLTYSLLIFIFLQLNLFAQERVFFGENGKEISSEEFFKRWSNKNLQLTRWDSIGKNKKLFISIKSNHYSKGVLKYKEIKNQLEAIIGRKLKNNNVLLLKYHFKDDLCTDTEINKWAKWEINSVKKSNRPINRKLKKDGVTMFYLFEEGIILKNNVKNKKEYFFLDKHNFFRYIIFKNPTMCGSYALIKPNGETLIRNTELRDEVYSPDLMIQYLKEDIWNVFFEEKK